MTELSQLLRQLCSREILAKVRDPALQPRYFIGVPAGAAISYTAARILVENPDVPVVDCIARAVVHELNDFKTSNKIGLNEDERQLSVRIESAEKARVA